MSDKDTVIHVSPDGNDRWSGASAEPNRRATDGPLATVKGAQREVRRLIRNGLKAPVRVMLRGGTYFQSSAVVFTAADGGSESEEFPKALVSPPVAVTWSGYPGESPIISGGKRITGWQETEVNGHRAWVAPIPAVKRGNWHFQQLWVNGERRLRPRFPREGLYRIERLVDVNKSTPYHHGQDQFVYAKGDLNPDWHSLQDVEVIALSYWTESRMWIVEISRRRRLVVFDRKSSKRLTDDLDTSKPTDYYVENVFEAVEPGQWYLDRQKGKLYYLPLPGEEPDKAEVIAPKLTELVRMGGKKPVTQLHFEGIAFSHNQWDLPPDQSNVGQASSSIPGAVVVSNAHSCTFSRCAFSHLGSYGFELRDGCLDVQLIGCDVVDLGAGGVKIWHGCRRNTISDCDIGDGGILFPSAVGVLVGQSSGNKVIHNHIHDFSYTGISVGWCWGYAESEAYGNIIENNVAYRTNCSGFHQHYGRNNVIQNNIWAFGRREQLALTRLEQHHSFIFRHNLVYFDKGELLAWSLKQATAEHVVFDHNLYWHREREEVSLRRAHLPPVATDGDGQKQSDR